MNELNKIRFINAKERFNITEILPQGHDRFFADKPPVTEEGYKPVLYTCGNCGYGIVFSKDNLLSGERNRKTKLSQEDALGFDEIAKQKKIEGLSFLDFYCPQCNLAVRIYYETQFGGHHGDSSFSLKYVIEKKD